MFSVFVYQRVDVEFVNSYRLTGTRWSSSSFCVFCSLPCVDDSQVSLIKDMCSRTVHNRLYEDPVATACSSCVMVNASGISIAYLFLIFWYKECIPERSSKDIWWPWLLCPLPSTNVMFELFMTYDRLLLRPSFEVDDWRKGGNWWFQCVPLDSVIPPLRHLAC